MREPTVAAVGFGEGVYSFPAAAELIQAKPATLRYWMRTGLAPASYDRGLGRSDVLSFHDLISLEIVRRMRAKGVSLQRIRVLESELRRARRDVLRPFAHEVFWTDGADVWWELEPGDEQLVQGTGKDRRQLAWKTAVGSFAEQIDYRDGVASRWRLAVGVELDPRVRFGEPVVAGTRIPVKTIAANLEAGTPEEVARWFELTLRQVEAARDYAQGRR